MIAISERPISTMILAEHVYQNADGTVVLVMEDGRVVSVQPDGRIEYRPEGTKGAYERGTINGSTIVYNPTNKIVYAFAFAAKVQKS